MLGHWRLLGTLCVGVGAAILVVAPAEPRPTPGYGDLIDNYCVSRGRLRVATHQPHCAMCHQPGTFDSVPGNRVEPIWTEFEQGKGTGDFSYFCPGGGAAAAPAATGQSVSSPTPQAVAPAISGSVTPQVMPVWPSVPAYPGAGVQVGMAHMMPGREMGGMGRMGGMAQTMPPASQDAPQLAPSTTTTPQAAAATGQPDLTALVDRPPVVPAEVEQRLALLRDEIGVRDAQRASWDAFAEAVRAAAARHRGFVGSAAPPAVAVGDALGLIQQQQRHLSARLAALRSVSTDFTRLLAVLDDAQRKKANERLASVLETL